MRLFLLTIFLVSFFESQAQKPTDKRLAGLDTAVARILKDWKAPGVTVAVIEKNKVVYTGGFGYRDLEKKLPVTENTLFAIGSCTKAFTASMIGSLAKDGLVDIDKPVRNYLPELRFYNEYLNDHVTLRDMMCHRTGLPRHDYSWYGSTASRMELLKRIEYQEPTAELREKWQYNNFMFMSQGVVIEKITGKSWESNIQERIFNPLGMSQTNTSTVDLEKSSDRSLAYSLKNDSIAVVIPYKNIDAVGPAGSINSSARDMAKWLITWVNGGKYNGKEIIPANHVNQAMQIQMASGAVPSGENADVQNFGYGFAWGISSYRGHYRVEHGGGIDGFITTTGFFPTDSIGIFVSSCNGAVSASIRNWIADRMLGLSYRDWHKSQRDPYVKSRFAAMMMPKTKDSSNMILNTHPSLALKEYTGSYSNKGYGSIKVLEKDGKLNADYNGSMLILKHKHYDLFAGKTADQDEDDNNETPLFFQLGKDGKVAKVSVPLQPGLSDIEFTKDIDMAPMTSADLEKYTGEFAIGPQPVSFVIRNNTLFALLPPQPDYELTPIGKDEFKLKILDGFKVKFKLDDKQKASEASFIQPNGVFVAKRK
ncbi:MAG: serine hydrolase [Saprospiraceae bacterium]